jgi:glycosyltransferase involved in cell wall biosynthesis
MDRDSGTALSDVPFSVLLSTYEGDDPGELETALQSVINQTATPDEILIVVDGTITSELDSVIRSHRNDYSDAVRTLRLSKNRGLGVALRRGVEACSHDLVARMDADDISVCDRFERQLDYLETHPETHVLGGYAGEFETDPDDIVQIRSVPTTPSDVRSFARFRCPTNHPTVMFRRQAVLDVGNYRPLHTMQDYDLWMRMLAKGYTIDNIPDVLVKFRTGGNLHRRRGGTSYAQLELRLQRDFLSYGAITLPVFLFNICTRVPIRLIPAFVRKKIYNRFFRR